MTARAIQVVCFLWRDDGRGYRLPRVVDYGPAHVNTLRRMVARHLTMPHEFVCVTDSPEGLDSQVRVVPLWDKCRALGGCFNRLYLFSPDMREIIGHRFVAMDLDSVVVGPLDPLFDRPEDFVVNAYQGASHSDPDQYLNGSMVLMDAGARGGVWERFAADPQAAVRATQEGNRKGTCIGSDQAWMRLVLGKKESRWTEADGVHEARKVGQRLPAGARVVFFSGRRDPTTWEQPWVRKHYR